METLPSSPFLWLEFDKGGQPRDPAVFDRIKQALENAGASELVVMSHGWKNDREAAFRIYRPLWENTVAVLDRDPAKIVVAGVLWPSVPYRDNIDEAALLQAASEGGLSSGSGLPVEDIDDETLARAVADFLGDEGDDDFSDLVSQAAVDLSSDAAAELFRRAVERVTDGSDLELAAEVDTLIHLAADDPKSALQGLASRPIMPVDASVGGGLGVGETAEKVFEGGKAAITRLLGQLTYFDMKKRAGVVGKSLGKHLAKELPASTQLHLVGHSFGARLVTAAATEYVAAGRKAQSLTLLQGAFSHNALAPSFEGKPGAFASAVAGIDVIAITHTHNDKACTLAYAIASRISRDVASAVGDANDRFGSMGANGAQNVPTVRHTALPSDPVAAPQRGAINNYLADAWIRGNPPGHDAHGDVFNPEAGHLLAAVLKA